MMDVLMAGLSSPDVKDKRLLEKYNAPTPAELIKTMLLPGEIEDLAREIEKLSGFRSLTIEEIKKNKKRPPADAALLPVSGEEPHAGGLLQDAAGGTAIDHGVLPGGD